MKCSDFEKLENKYMDGNITPEEHEAMLAHAGECESCRRELALCDEIMSGLENLPVPQIQEDFTLNVMSAVRAVPKPNRGLLFLVVCSVVGALSSVAGFLNLVILNRAELVEAIADNAVLAPFVSLINMLAAFDSAARELASSVLALFDIYKESMTFGAFAAGIIALGIYAALKKSVIGGVGK